MQTQSSSFEFIPMDLLIEILSRLPAKFIARCRCVSKLWGSIILRPDFTELVMTTSMTIRPQLLFASRNKNHVSFYSSPIVANYHMKFPLNCVVDYVHGLICLAYDRFFKRRKDTVFVICNPSTGQSLTLPRVKTRVEFGVTSFFGYDPIGKQFKLLSMIISKSGGGNILSEDHQILTLGNGKLSWRMIECSVLHYPTSGENGLCINGVLYYIATLSSYEEEDGFRIACFDFRSEKFKFIEVESKAMRGTLVNYKGKLATFKSNNLLGGSINEISTSVELCILEDAEKHEWSTHTYVLPSPLLSTDIFSSSWMDIIGVTRTSEIVFSLRYYPSGPFYLVYYNLERNTFVKVEIQGMDVSQRPLVHTFIDHVEDVKLGGVFKT